MMKKPLQSTPLKVEISDIDLNPGPFCMSFHFDLGLLKASIEGFGILNPPYLLSNSDEGFRVVAGYRRLLALRELGWPDTVCRILPDDFPPFEALLLNLHDNLVHRRLNSVEKGMVLHRLTPFLTTEEIITDFMPILGIPSNREALQQFLGLEELEEAIRISVAMERLSPRVAGLMGGLGRDDRLRINDLFVSLRWSFSQQWEAALWIIEIAGREGRSIREVIENECVTEVLKNGKMNGPQKVRAIVRALRQRRFPTLMKSETSFNRGVSDLALPSRVRVIPPPFFEGADYRLEIVFREGKELREKVARLHSTAGLEGITSFWEAGK
jgi:ParB-like chromosome segregation protein Spo0J